MKASPLTMVSMRFESSPIDEAIVERKKEATRNASASATHLICCRSTPLERRNRNTNDVTLPTSRPMSERLNTASEMSRRPMAGT